MSATGGCGREMICEALKNDVQLTCMNARHSNRQLDRPSAVTPVSTRPLKALSLPACLQTRLALPFLVLHVSVCSPPRLHSLLRRPPLIFLTPLGAKSTKPSPRSRNAPLQLTTPHRGTCEPSLSSALSLSLCVSSSLCAPAVMSWPTGERPTGASVPGPPRGHPNPTTWILGWTPPPAMPLAQG